MTDRKKKYTKTQLLICDAYFSLLEDKDNDKISISEICDKAQVVRKSFYNNFSTKEDVLDFGVNYFFDTWETTTSMASSDNMTDIYRAAFEFVDSRRDIFILLKNRNMYHIAELKLTDYIHKKWPQVSNCPINDNFAIYSIPSMIAAFTCILKIWVERDFADSIDCMVELTDKLIHTRKNN